MPPEQTQALSRAPLGFDGQELEVTETTTTANEDTNSYSEIIYSNTDAQREQAQPRSILTLAQKNKLHQAKIHIPESR